MKLRFAISLTLAAAILAACTGVLAEPGWTARQDTAHEIAELARSLGLPEDDAIILRAQEIWQQEEELKAQMSEEDIRIIATVIYNEAGNGCSEEHMLLVGRVVMNRVNDERFPDTVHDVVLAPRQYHPAYVQAGSRYAVPDDRLEDFEALARRVLAGEPYDCPPDVLYQDNNRHGTGVYKSFLSDFGSTTYFCYG
jgi:hypothetical protein